MNRNIALLLLLCSWLTLTAAATGKGVQSGVILRIEKKSHVRTLYYLHNTPVEAEDPYYEMTVESAGQQYSAEYEPRNAAEALPDECAAGQEVKLKIEKRELYLQLAGGRDMKWSITKRRAAPPSSETR